MTLTVVCFTNRGKTRLAKWYVPYSDDEKIKLKGEVSDRRAGNPFAQCRE